MFLIDSSFETASTKMELVVEKILRPTQTPGVSRPRLLTILEQSLSSCASTIISGRAGTGKTALAVDFSRKCRRPAAWYKVDAPDADLRIFFQYLIASIQKYRTAFGSETLTQLVKMAELNNIPMLAEAFVYELAEGESSPLLIVIEDLHLVCDSEWLVPFLSRLLPLLPSEVHMLITSRTMPPAPFWRMRSKQTLMVIDEEALAFTRSEAGKLFESHGLSNEQASIALDHTHGRAAALAAFAASLSKVETRTVSLTADTLPRLSSV